MVLDSSGSSLQQATDAELVACYKAGTSQAFDVLVIRYTPALYNLIYRITGNRAEAENLTQETWLRFWSVLPRLQLDRPLKPYLVKIGVNLCRTWAAQAKIPLLSLDASATPDWLTDEADDVIERLQAEELQRRVHVAIKQLSPLYRAVITLRYAEELAYEEIAQALDLPLNTVRTYLRRAKLQLRELLGKEEKRGLK